MSLLKGFEPREMTAGNWHEYLVRALRLASGQRWKSMHEAMSPGRSRCHFGLVWLCKQMNVVRKMAEDEVGGEQVFLGASQLPYALLSPACSHDKLKNLLEGIATCKVVFPQASSQGAVLEYARQIAELCQFVVGKDAELSRGYSQRRFLSFLERRWGWAVWDDVRMDVLSAWMPDEQGHLDSLHGWPGSLVRRRFGMSPLAVSGQSCMWGAVAAKHLEALRDASAIDILNAVIRSSLHAGGSMASSHDGRAGSSQGMFHVATPTERVADLWANGQQ